MEKKDFLAHIVKRIQDMEAERSSGRIDWISERKTCEDQYEAPTFEDNEGNFIPNSLMEQNTIEMELGRRAGLPKFDIKPDPFTPNLQETEASKYVLDEFLDRENFYPQQVEADQNGEIYGTRVLYDGLRMYVETVKELNQEAEVGNQPGAAFYDTKQYKDNTRITYFMTPQAINVKDLLIDDRNLRQPNFDKVEDVVMIERLAPETFKQRFGGNSIFDQEVVETAQPIQDDGNTAQVMPTRGQIILYHYFNKVSKDYGICVNRTALLYKGILPYVHGKLPFSVGQCYPNAGCIYGRSTPRKLRSEKAFENDLYENVIKGARLSSSKVLVTSGDTTDGDIITVPGSVSMVKFNAGVEGTKDIDTRVDILPMLKAMDVVESKKRQNTGVDINAPFTPQAPTLGQTEIIEENKALRQKAKDQLRDFWLDDALTKTLCNIKQFAPTLLAQTKEIKGEDGKVIKKIYNRPKLTIQNVKVTKSNGETVITEDLGGIGYLELDNKTIQGNLTVRVVTPNTVNKTLQALEKEKVKEMIDNRTLLAKIVGVDKVEEYMPIKDIMERMAQVYGYEKNMTPTTKLSREKKAVRDKINEIKKMIDMGGPDNSVQSLPGTGQNETTQPTPANGQEIQNPMLGSSPAEVIGMGRDQSSKARTGRRN